MKKRFHFVLAWTLLFLGWATFQAMPLYSQNTKPPSTFEVMVVGPLVYSSHFIDDVPGGTSPNGDGDGKAESGEHVALAVRLLNVGNQTAVGVESDTLTSSDPDVTILDSDNCWPDIPGGQIRENACNYEFRVNPNLAQDKTVTFTMTVIAQNGGPWTSTFSVQIFRQNQITAPSNLSAGALNNTTARLSWSWQDNSPSEQGFKIERKTGGAGSYSEIATVGLNVTTYDDGGLTSGQTYCYRVRAYVGQIHSAYSNEACVSLSLNLANLTATAFSFSPTTVARGNAINLSGTVINNGNASTSAGFNVKCYLSTSPNAPDLNLFLNSFTMPALGAGQSNPFNQIGTVPATTPAGQYYVWVSVDPDNAIAESNDTDNLLRTTSLLTVTTGPVGEIKPDVAATQFIGAEFEVAISVKDVQNLFGLSFELNYTNTIYVDVVTPTGANVLPGPFLGSDVIFLANVDEGGGKVSIGVSRKSGQGGVNGSGVVASIRFKSLASTPPNTQVVFTLTNVAASDQNGGAIALTASSHTVTVIGIIVWPGDTNNDKIVNQADVLPLGLYWNRTGPQRANASSNWIGQPATPWLPENATYADANGDGNVNQADVLPIGLNWGRTHPASNPVAGRGDAPIFLGKITASTIRANITGNTNPGQDFDVEIIVDQVTNLFGVSFDCNSLKFANAIHLRVILSRIFLDSCGFILYNPYRCFYKASSEF
jgi:hypothetical protein